MTKGDNETPAYARLGSRILTIAEDVVYVAIAGLLIAIALAVLVDAAGQLLQLPGEGVQTVALDALDSLLLVFIVVELLFAVKATLSKRELVAEPFLLVGIIASIKEIVVLSVKAAEEVGGDPARFDDQMTEIGVLGVLVLLLGITAWLLRLKEREPDEGDGERRRRAGEAPAVDPD